MSHFSVGVILPERPTGENVLLTKALQPFHEYECTGHNDEHVKNVDKTEDCRKKYEQDTAIMVVERPDGSRVYAFDEQGSYIEELKPFFTNDSLELPDGWKKIRDEPAKDHVDFKSWAAQWEGVPILDEGEEPDPENNEHHKWGWVREVDGEVVVVNRTNPDAKWDWWSVGGRWKNMLDVVGAAENVITGDEGVMGSVFKDEGCDGCRVGDLDLEKMKFVNVAQRRDVVDRWVEKSGLPREDFMRLWKNHVEDLPKTKAAFDALPEKGRGTFADFITKLGEGNSTFDAREAGLLDWNCPVPDTVVDVDSWITDAPPLTLWALLKDGEWQEKGQMGWFGLSTNDKPEDEWEDHVMKTIRELPQDHWIVVVDCHI